jgi:hypothetical protein
MFAPWFAFVNRSVRKLIYVSTADHRYTFRAVRKQLRAQAVDAQILSYERLFCGRFTPAATYIFTDFDRLSASELEAATLVRDRIVAAGSRVINDPRNFLPRDALLRRLHQSGINRFACFAPAHGEWPGRFPVFLRTIAAHRGVLGDLLHDSASAKAALAHALAAGHPISDLMLVEYAAEPQPETGTFQKHAAFRVGTHIIRANTVNDTSWAAKTGVRHGASDAQYRAERAEMDAYPHTAFVEAVFDLAGMEFGRIDFGIVAGRPQAYEINTNPMMVFASGHENADRQETVDLMQARLVTALAEVAGPVGGPRISLSRCFKTGKSLLLRRPRRR